MRVTVNGEPKDVAATRVDTLLGELEFEGTHFAIAINYDVVPRARWSETEIAEGDMVEILTPRQGG
ncbi:sulfur carrier protein ThiS [Bradyrhizobium sp. LHD-71]|uniref:sulfur carrier protein ThiS n=1 Tax=Bradyrhizobium sp. LHD-71 TaxID=3072141 RepID=UPI00280E19AC|nr:sulfur carrier protein ThiS [Bradyrhizobium sp. LHD-71]MDQ8727790.1 sulfur carrier protein ThiS [Bradyrhizobium sp. LHD-71]